MQAASQEATLGVQKRDVEHSEDGEKGMIVGYLSEVQPKECADGRLVEGAKRTTEHNA